jgi:histidine triad (HIT) family protein
MEYAKKDLEIIKEKVIEQIKKNFPQEQQEKYISQINSMEDSQFIEFLKQQGILKESGEQKGTTKCLFCSIIFGEIPSTKIAENEKAIAILELNPISKGHSLIIPKEHIEKRDKIPKEVYDLAKETGIKISKRLNPKDVKIYEGKIMNHQIINLLPIYNDETPQSQRTKKTQEELEELKKILQEEKQKEPVEETQPEEEINEKNTWLPKRIP